MRMTSGWLGAPRAVLGRVAGHRLGPPNRPVTFALEAQRLIWSSPPSETAGTGRSITRLGSRVEYSAATIRTRGGDRGMAPENKATATGQNAPGNGHDGIGNVVRAGLHVIASPCPRTGSRPIRR